VRVRGCTLPRLPLPKAPDRLDEQTPVPPVAHAIEAGLKNAGSAWLPYHADQIAHLRVLRANQQHQSPWNQAHPLFITPWHRFGAKKPLSHRLIGLQFSLESPKSL
jgi:hypothetical protein